MYKGAFFCGSREADHEISVMLVCILGGKGLNSPSLRAVVKCYICADNGTLPAMFLEAAEYLRAHRMQVSPHAVS